MVVALLYFRLRAVIISPAWSRTSNDFLRRVLKFGREAITGRAGFINLILADQASSPCPPPVHTSSLPAADLPWHLCVYPWYCCVVPAVFVPRHSPVPSRRCKQSLKKSRVARRPVRNRAASRSTPALGRRSLYGLALSPCFSGQNFFTMLLTGCDKPRCLSRVITTHPKKSAPN